MSRNILLMSLVLLLLLSGCSGGVGQEAPRKVTIAMGFIPNVQFTPMYVALDRGYFSQEGIEVELDYGMETDLLQRVGTDDLQFAVASGDQVILARANELPVQYVFNWYRRFPVCVVSMADRGILTPADLVGKTVGIPVMEGASYIGWLAFLEQVGLSPDQVNLQVVGYTQVASLTEGRVDAAVCYAMNEPVQLQQSGYQVNTFYLADYTHLVSNGIVSNDKTISKDAKLVQGIVRAFRHGLEDTINDPDAAFAITLKAIPEMDADTALLQRAVLDECLHFWSGGEPLGVSEEQDWQESSSLLVRLGLVSEELKATSLFTNAFAK